MENNYKSLFFFSSGDRKLRDHVIFFNVFYVYFLRIIFIFYGLNK